MNDKYQLQTANRKINEIMKQKKAILPSQLTTIMKVSKYLRSVPHISKHSYNGLKLESSTLVIKWVSSYKT